MTSVPQPSRHKPRLFGVMVIAFALAIVVGVCGMIGFVGLAFAGMVPTESRGGFRDAPPAYAALLADYYLANDRSWEGVQARIDGAPFGMGFGFAEFLVADANGQVVASSESGAPPEARLDDRTLGRGVPIIARGERVGTLVLRPGGSPPAWQGRGSSGAAAFLRTFAFAGLGLALVLIALGTLFAGWLSRPLRRLTNAAGELASGRLEVQVPPAAVRELDDLGQAFNRMARSLADADRQRRQMTADVAHELRTPLTIIRGRLEGMQDGVYQASSEQIGRLLAETDLLERLIDDLRLLALAEAGQLRLYHEQVDPAELLYDAAAAFAGQAEAAGVTIRVEVAGEPPPVEADPQRMAQVLANLVSNALRHTTSGGTITLAASRGGAAPRRAQHQAGGVQPAVVISVSDTGSGIAPEDLPQVFERFWRADPSRARASGGAGLGLAIAKQIVQAHGGEIRAESAVGHGTTITITLPGATSALAGTSTPRPASASRSDHRAR
jgi:signal transduction histidine kinase